MKKVDYQNLENIVGGSSTVINGAFINAFVNVINLLTEAGRAVGSSLRRIAEGKVCPLD